MFQMEFQSGQNIRARVSSYQRNFLLYISEPARENEWIDVVCDLELGGRC